jgi:hypothetical protein
VTKLVNIEHLLDESSRRFFSDSQLAPDPALVAEGWERRFTADCERAAEAIALYADLGYEVRAEQIRSEQLQDDCTDCHSQAISTFRTVYTRKRKS